MRSLVLASAVLVAVGCASQTRDDDLDVTPGGADGDAIEKADDLADGAPRVELKVTLAPSSIARARSRLGLSNSSSRVQDIWFYDTPLLALFHDGAILRARDVAGADDDSTVKLRPLAVEDVDPSWLEVAGFKCEIDRLPDRSISSCSLTTVQGEDEIEDVADGDRGIVKLFSDEQETFLAEHGPSVDWDAVVALGPLPARVWKLSTKALPAKLSAELWYLPDGEQVLELSMKVDAPDADEAQAELLEWVADRGLTVGSTQETKTARALELLASQR